MIQNVDEVGVKKLAIIGGGPRGLSALESLYGCLAVNNKSESLYTVFFEAYELPGAGHVYDLEQLDTNWLNVSERGLTIPRRAQIKSNNLIIPAFPSYHEWAGYDLQKDGGKMPDIFPLRSNLGKYLNERYVSIASVLIAGGLLQVVYGEVVETDWKNELFEITLKDGTLFHVDEVVLTIGHQPTKDDEQISDWLAYNDSNNAVGLITEPYPVKHILNAKRLDPEAIVALRGFGLAMIDVMRALTVGLGGKFEIIDKGTQKMNYFKSGNEPKKIVPFSLDGLPMAPKPLNLKIDTWFFPSEKEKENLKYTVGHNAEMGTAKNNQFLIDAMTPIIANVFIELRSKAYPHNLTKTALQNIVSSYLLDEDFEHTLIIPTSDPTEDILEAFVGMATGTRPISLDYCIGQVWRHCQPTLYKALSFSNFEEEAIADIVGLDERLKRYSYGPPVASLQQMLALLKVGLISLTYVNDPEIVTTENGWKLSKNENDVLVHLMVNSVLDSPKLLAVNSPVVRNLLQDSLVQPVHGALGIETYENACVSLEKKADEVPLAVLGRLSKGTLIGVDAILECFGIRSELWAEGVINRLSD